VNEVSLAIGVVGLFLGLAGVITILGRSSEWTAAVDGSRWPWILGFVLSGVFCAIGTIVIWVLYLRGPARDMKANRELRTGIQHAPPFVPPAPAEASTVTYTVGLVDPLRCAHCGAIVDDLDQGRCRGCGATLDWANSQDAVQRFQRREPDA
jgi:hypothetical protein